MNGNGYKTTYVPQIMEEEELADLRMQQRQFEELRNAELVEQQRLEEQERRHREEKVFSPIRYIPHYLK